MSAPIALLYPGDRAMRDRADPAESRFAALFGALARAGLPAEPAIWNEDVEPDVKAQLLRARAVLVWCNPIEGGRRRDRLDAMLREVSDAGIFVSAHPDTIVALGTKDVLVATRHLPFGSDVHRVDRLDRVRAEVLDRVRAGPRVLKQHRGHSGIGVWRIESAGDDRYAVRHAQRGSDAAVVDAATLAGLLAPYFEPEAGGHMIDQAWQPRISEGMLRAYLVGDRVAGFGHQAVNALASAQPGPRLYHDADWPPAQALRRSLEAGWIEALCRAGGVARERLPLLWDADFIAGEVAGEGDAWVLCEVNVSSVSPFPPSCIAPLVRALADRC